MTRHFKPVLVEADGELYEIHLGAPGRPRVYRRVGTQHRRVQDGDPILATIAREMRAGVDRRKAAEDAERARRGTRRYRALAYLGRIWYRVTGWVSRALTPFP
jgi:hypothetical protein